MALKKPVVLGANGDFEELQAGDTISVSTTALNTVQATNASGASQPIGTPVYVSGAGAVQPARANALATTRCRALVADASIAASAVGAIGLDGFMTASTAQWDAVTGQTGGLTPGAVYFLSSATAGRLTSTRPTGSGNYCQKIGVALSATDFLIDIEDPILLAA